MKPIINHVLVKVEKTTEDTITTGILDANGEALSLHLDTSYKPLEHARIFGEVVAIPLSLGDDMVYEIEEGFPRHLKAVDSNDIERMIANVPELLHPRYASKYNTSAWVPKYVTMKNHPINLEIGDRVYFHYLSLQNVSYVDNEANENIYKVGYDQIFCAVRTYTRPYIADVVNVSHRKIVMLTGYILVEPYYGEGFETIDMGDKTIKAKTTTVGGIDLVTETVEKPKFLHGVISHIGEPVLPYSRETLKAGDIILYTETSDFKNEIEGTEYYVMRQWDVFCKVVDGKLIPVGDWVLIDPVLYTTSLIILLDANIPVPNEGTILMKGELCSDDISVGEKVRFNNKGVNYIKVEEYNALLVREGEIMFKY